MSISPTAAQQRERETRIANPIVWCGIAGSVVFHIGILPLLLLISWTESTPEPSQIEIIVTEPLEAVEEEPKPALLDEETSDATVSESPAPLPAVATQAIPTPEPDLDQPEPDPAETTEDILDTLEELQPLIGDAVEEEEIVEPAAAEAQTDLLQDWLEAMRRSRQQQAAAARDQRQGRSESTDASEPGNQGDQSEVAAAPSQPASGSDRGGGSRTVACRSCPKPRYPRSALNAGAEGTVNVVVDINEEGRVTSASLVGSSGHTALDQAALSTVRNNWRFQPIRGGASGVVVSVVMTIQGSDLHRQAQERGDRDSVEIPDSEPELSTLDDQPERTASDESDASDSGTASSSDESSSSRDSAEPSAEPSPAPSDANPEPASSSADPPEPPPATQPDPPEPPPPILQMEPVTPVSGDQETSESE